VRVAIVSGFFTPAEAKIRLAFARALRHGRLVYVPVDDFARLKAELEDAMAAQQEVLLLCGQKPAPHSASGIDDILRQLTTAPASSLTIGPQDGPGALKALAHWLGDQWQDHTPDVGDIARAYPNGKVICLSHSKNASIQTIFKDIGISRSKFELIGTEYRAGGVEEAKRLLDGVQTEAGPLLIAEFGFFETKLGSGFPGRVFRKGSALSVALEFLEHIRERVSELDLHSAKEKQESLLPKSPLVWSGSYSLLGRCIPCRLVGGDFFDWFELPGGRLAAALVDVESKGPAAGLLAAEIKGMLFSSFQGGRSVAETASLINERLFNRASPTTATAVLAILDRDGHVDLINCGHVQPLLVRNDGLDILKRGVRSVGCFSTHPASGESFLDEALVEADRLEMEHGNRLLVVTDGITEAENDEGEFFGNERLGAVILSGGGVQEILDAVDQFRGEVPLNDDCTVIEIARL